MMTETTTSTADSPLLQAMTGHRPAVTPVWFMRQAGRSLPEYRKAREGTTMLDSCLNPQLAAEITCQPVRRHHVDGAVLYSDIMVPLAMAEIGVRIEPSLFAPRTTSTGSPSASPAMPLPSKRLPAW